MATISPDRANRRRRLGQRGEDVAARHLQSCGYVILQRNYRCPSGEMDIIAQDGARLAFVEVRTRQSCNYGKPEESVTAVKQARLANIARTYLQEKGYCDVDWGIDVVAIEVGANGTLHRIDLLRNAVIELP